MRRLYPFCTWSYRRHAGAFAKNLSPQKEDERGYRFRETDDRLQRMRRKSENSPTNPNAKGHGHMVRSGQSTSSTGYFSVTVKDHVKSSEILHEKNYVQR